MTKVYLFDWGNTLMVDFPGMPGKMCDWEKVEAVDGAEEALRALSLKAKIFIATSAADSQEKDIEAAFLRVGLDKYINGYFCFANVGVKKGHPDFLTTILNRLDESPDKVTMVGDSLKFDIEPALAQGMNAVWLNTDETSNQYANIENKKRIRMISSLNELHK